MQRPSLIPLPSIRANQAPCPCALRASDSALRTTPEVSRTNTPANYVLHPCVRGSAHPCCSTPCVRRPSYVAHYWHAHCWRWAWWLGARRVVRGAWSGGVGGLDAGDQGAWFVGRGRVGSYHARRTRFQNHHMTPVHSPKICQFLVNGVPRPKKFRTKFSRGTSCADPDVQIMLIGQIVPFPSLPGLPPTRPAPRKQATSVSFAGARSRLFFTTPTPLTQRTWDSARLTQGNRPFPWHLTLSTKIRNHSA